MCLQPAKQLCHGLHQKQGGQQGEGGNSDHLLCSYESCVEYHVQLWCSQHRKDTDLLEWVQRRVTKMVWGTEHFAYKEKLRQLRFLSLEKERLQGDLIEVSQSLKGANKKEVDKIFSRACWDRTRVNGFNQKEGQFSLHIGKKCFMMKVEKRWNVFPREVVDAASLEMIEME